MCSVLGSEAVSVTGVGAGPPALQLLFLGMKLPCVSVFLLCPVGVASFLRTPQTFRFAVAAARAPDRVLSPLFGPVMCSERGGVGGFTGQWLTGLPRWLRAHGNWGRGWGHVVGRGGRDGSELWGCRI